MSETLRSEQPTRWKESRLFERRSVLGALGMLVVVGLFVFVVPIVEDNVEQSGVTDDSGRFIIDDFTTMVLAEGWEVEDRNELFTTVTDGTYAMILTVSNEDATSPEDTLAEFHDIYAEDPANEVTDIKSFETDAGGTAAAYRAVIASDATGQGSGFGAVSQNGRLLQPGTTGPADLDDPFYEEFEAMLRSVVITAEPAGESS